MKRVMLVFLALIALHVFSSCTVPAETETLVPPLPEAVPEEIIEILPVPEDETPPLEIVVIEEVGVEETVNPETKYPFLGSNDAPLTITQYGDFADGVTSSVALVQVASIKRDYILNNEVMLVFVPYPLSDSGQASAEASWCMWEQGSKQFWSYYNVLAANYIHLEEKSLVNYADRIPNADKVVLGECVASRKYSGAIAASLSIGKKAGITKTPVFIIRDRKFEGNVPYKTIKAAIDDELASESTDSITGNVVFSGKSFYDVPKSILEFLKKIYNS